MTVSAWVSWCLSVIVTGVNWLKSSTLLNVPQKQEQEQPRKEPKKD